MVTRALKLTWQYLIFWPVGDSRTSRKHNTDIILYYEVVVEKMLANGCSFIHLSGR